MICAFMLIAGIFLFSGIARPLGEQVCRNPGPADLDSRYCDEDGDLVADRPKNPGQWLDPDPLIFSYTPVEDPMRYEKVFSELMAHLSFKTGKKVQWYAAASYALQAEAIGSGRLHVAAISPGPAVFAVNLSGFVPFAVMGRADGNFGYKIQLITRKDSDIHVVKDLKGRKVAHVSRSSNSGNLAPRALFKSMGIVPGRSYTAIYSGSHDNSILGVLKKKYDAAPVASVALERMVASGKVNMDDLRVVWESQSIPTTSFGHVYNLDPALEEKIKEAFLSFHWQGTLLQKQFGEYADRFLPVTFMEHWQDLRTIQKFNNVSYTRQNLSDLRVKKKR